MTKQIIFLVAFLSATLFLSAQSEQLWNTAAITEIIQQYTSDDLPGIAVGIVQDGQIVHEQYMGYADLTHRIKVDKNTRFNIASNAKQFTALYILKLIEDGKIKLSDDIRMYFPDLYSGITDKITIANLLTHTSGVRDYCDLLALQGKTWWRQFVDNEDVMELLHDQETLNFRPDAEYLYSNSNYILLAKIIEKVTNQKFNDAATALFEQLDMPNTTFFTHYGAIIPSRARPYGNWGVWREEPTIAEVHGDGALFTTLLDQLRWEQIVYSNSGKYLSQKLINVSQAPLATATEQGYGYGLFFGEYEGVNYVFHDGVTGAYNNTFLRFPDQDFSIVVMSNNRNVIANQIAWQIAFMMLGTEESNALYPAMPDHIETIVGLQEVTGIYKGEGENGTIIRIVEKKGSLYREIYQRDPVRLISEKGGLFEYETTGGLKMNFTNIGRAEQQLTLYKSTQPPSTYYKIADLTENNFDKTALNGRFYNAETDTEIILTFVEGDTFTLTKNGRARTAKLVTTDYLRMMDTYQIKLIRDEHSQVIGLNVKNRRIKNVIFERL
ncbi:MAG: serine hydrolase domain-containing protein [Bacteroidota bacterium]